MKHTIREENTLMTVEAAGKVFALVSIGYLLFCTIHDWFFFWMLAPSLQTLSSIQDMLSESAIWSPGLFLATAIAMFLVLPRKIAELSDSGPQTNTLSGQEWIGLTAMFAIGAIFLWGTLRSPLPSSTLFATVLGSLGTTLVFVPAFVVWIVLQKERLRGNKLAFRLILIGYIAFLVTPLSAWAGVFDAVHSLREEASYAMACKLPCRGGKVAPIRAMNKGLLYRERDGAISFVTWDLFQSLSFERLKGSK